MEIALCCQGLAMLSAPPPSQPFNPLMASCKNNVIVRVSCGDGETSFDAELNMNLSWGWLGSSVGGRCCCFRGRVFVFLACPPWTRCAGSVAEFIKLEKI